MELTRNEWEQLLRLASKGQREKYPTRAELLGKTVVSKDGESTGKVMFSTFGISIGGINEDGAHWQTLGDDPEEVMKHWKVVED